MDASEARKLEVTLAEQLEQLIATRGPQLSTPLRLVNLVIRDAYPVTQLILTLTSRDRPGCQFGYCVSVWEEGLQDFGAERLSTYLWLNLEEIVEAADMGLPNCGPGSDIVWLGEDA